MEKIMDVTIDTKVFVVINTTKYNGDGKASVRVVKGEEGAADLGWVDDDLTYLVNDEERYVKISEMKVNDIMGHNMYRGAYLMRIA